MASASRTILEEAAPRGKGLQLSRERQFWIFQMAGWSIWVLLLVIRDLTFVPAEYMLQRVAMFVVDAMIGMLLTTGLRHLYRWVWESRLPSRIAVVFFGSLAASLIWQPFQNLMEIFSFGDTAELAGTGWVSLFRGVLPFSFPLLLMWSGLYFFIKYYQLFQAEKEKSLRSEALAHEAQLRMLRYQLNPHFLFNTLHAISTLVLEKATGPANEMLIKLSKFLRYSLDHSPLDQVTLSHEIETSKLYLEIEKVRFGERMRLAIDIAETAQKALVPSMLLQPLIENSIKHAISRRESGGSISIRAHIEKRDLVLEVEDDGPGFEPESLGSSVKGFSGVGLNNIRNRLKEIYGSNHQLIFSNMVPSGCKVTMVIPYETE